MGHGRRKRDAVVSIEGDRPRRREWLAPFLWGVLAAGSGMALASAVASRRRRLDHLRLIRPSRAGVPPVVVIPGIMGSRLLRPDGTPVWLNVRNAIGHYDLSLPLTVPLSESRDDLVPGPLLGTTAVMPRLFGFTEYYDLLDILAVAGFRAATSKGIGQDLAHHLFSYDWRRDLVETARRLHDALDQLAEARGDPDARFNVIGHSMGGLVARYYLRYGTAEPGGPVTWAGARRIANLVLVAVPNAGGIHALEAMLYGNRVGLSHTTLAAPVIARMPSVYQLMPPRGAPALLDDKLEPLDVDLHDPATWDHYGWGPFAPARRNLDLADDAARDKSRAFLEAALSRSGAFHRALAREPETHCPVRVVILGGDCLPTIARGIVPDKRGLPPRFVPWNRKENDLMFDAGDGRVTRASVLASHLPLAEQSLIGCGLPEVADAVFGSADHHGIYREPTFQSILLRLLLRPVRRAAPSVAPSATAG
jgi:pimeloyl-ACP methyl ester carboxylesterase